VFFRTTPAPASQVTTYNDDQVEAVLARLKIDLRGNLSLLTEDLNNGKFSLPSLQTAAKRREGRTITATRLAEAAHRVETTGDS
jgi:hypothetical protein